MCNQVEAITSNLVYCLSIHSKKHAVKCVVGVSLVALKGQFFSMGLLHEGKRRATGVSELRWGQGGRSDLQPLGVDLSMTLSSVNNYGSVCFYKWTQAEIRMCVHFYILLDAHISMAFSRCIAAGRIYTASKTGSCHPYPLSRELFLYHLYVYCPVNVANTCLQVSATVMAGQSFDKYDFYSS